MTGTERVVIVGASAAGVAVASELRTLGHIGDILLIGEETHLPYDRPPVSKHLLAGDWDLNRVQLKPAGDYERSRIELLLGSRATSVDPDRRTVRLAGGEAIGYDVLVAATGVSPRRLAAAEGLSNVHYLRTVDEAVRLRCQLAPGRRIGLIGAGFVGLEVAALAATRGCEVHVVEALDVPLATKLDSVVGGMLRALHESNGVVFHLATMVEHFDAESGHVRGLRLGDGTVVEVDEVVVGVGTTPNTEWLEGSVPLLPPDQGGGIPCDPRGRVRPGIYAAGDVAAYLEPASGRYVRREHRMNATEQGRHVARVICGSSAPFVTVPFFWTDQYDTKVQMYGSPTPGSVFGIEEQHGEPRRLVGTFRSDGRLTAVVGWNAAKLLAPYRRQLAEQMAGAVH